MTHPKAIKKFGIHKHMPSCLIFTTDDIGTNYRLLRHAKSFSELPESHVLIFAPDFSSLPKEIENSPNITHRFLFSLNFSYYFKILLFPVKFFFYFFQCIYLYYLYAFEKSIPHFDYIISPSFPILDNIYAKILAKIFRSQLIIDVSLFRWANIQKSNEIMMFLEKQVLYKADYLTCSTRSIQVILQLRKLKSFIIHDPPGKLFHPNDKLEIKNEIYSFLGITNLKTKNLLVAIPLPFYDNQYIRIVKSLCGKINAFFKNEKGTRIIFVVFGSPKVQDDVESNLRDMNDNSNCISMHFIPVNTDSYAHIMGCCDFSILLSGSRYGLDYSPELTELIASCVPVIVGKSGCVSEIIVNGKNGFIFNTEEELYEITKNIIIHSEHLCEMKKLMNQESFSWDEEWKKFHDSLSLKVV